MLSVIKNKRSLPVLTSRDLSLEEVAGTGTLDDAENEILVEIAL
jgi:hypothetical protein